MSEGANREELNPYARLTTPPPPSPPPPPEEYIDLARAKSEALVNNT